ncbi:MAG: methyltransferase domain-containing protein [Desulfuromonadales bacterium]|nr:methyltransferase domain-containing protein [Desulfuromonadales bacterium]
MSYLMEHPEEFARLAQKTRAEQVIRQAEWAGIKPGMHVLDAGCGSGTTTSILKQVVGENGRATGLDVSAARLTEARATYGNQGITFTEHNLREPFDSPDSYDAVWIRFLLEYFRDDPVTIVKNAIRSLKPGGILVLADLDNNSLIHYGIPERLEKTISEIVQCLEESHNFDPYSGRKLYAHMSELKFTDIHVNVEAHHLIYGKLNPIDAANWQSKIQVAVKNSGCSFREYDGDFSAMHEEFNTYFNDPRRFIYTPLIIVRGRKPFA